MALVAAKAHRFTATVKANEHGSKVGNTPPVQLHYKDASFVDTDALEAGRQAFAGMVSGWVVANSLASVSANPGDSLNGSTVGFVTAGSKNDWPEANANRTAEVLLSDDSGQHFYKFTIPYVADGVTSATIRTALETHLAAYEVVKDPTIADPPRMTVVRSIALKDH